MNRIKNDYGQWVIAVGSENSLERMKVKWPKLIAEMKVRYFEIPVASIIANDLEVYGFENWEAKVISLEVQRQCGDL